MKAAIWGVGFVVMGLVAMLLINIFGNITVTNQLNYTTMKNAVQGAMYDAVDLARYRSGFCFCTKSQSPFINSNQYEIKDVVDNECDEGCKLVEGEYKIDANVFSESLTRRFAEMVDNDKDYRIVISNVIEYPPKASVRIDSKDKQIMSETEFTIVNEIDGLLEERNKES